MKNLLPIYYQNTGIYYRHGGSFVQTLWRPVPVATGQGTGQATPQVKKRDSIHLEQLAAALSIPTPQVATQVEKVLQAATTAQSLEELQQAVALADRKHFRESLLNPLIEAGWLALTIPETPSSRLQKYLLTDKGRAWLESAT